MLVLYGNQSSSKALAAAAKGLFALADMLPLECLCIFTGSFSIFSIILENMPPSLRMTYQLNPSTQLMAKTV